MAATEIIDLTGPSSSQNAPSDNDVLFVTNINSPRPESRSTRRKRSKKSSTNATPSTTAPPSRSNSLERNTDAERRVKRKRRDSQDDADVGQSTKHSRRDSKVEDASGKENVDFFFFDLNPTPIPSISETLAPEAKEEIGGKLLLPAHITVLGSTPVEIIAPPSDSEDEDFIKYLDYDDAKVCITVITLLERGLMVFCRTFCDTTTNPRTKLPSSTEQSVKTVGQKVNIGHLRALSKLYALFSDCSC